MSYESTLDKDEGWDEPLDSTLWHYFIKMNDYDGKSLCCRFNDPPPYFDKNRTIKELMKTIRNKNDVAQFCGICNIRLNIRLGKPVRLFNLRKSFKIRC